LFAALKIMECLQESEKKCSELRLFTPCPTISKNIRVTDKSVIFRSNVREAMEKFSRQLEGKGKLIVRPSGTEQLIRISAEGELIDELQNIVDELSWIIGRNL